MLLKRLPIQRTEELKKLFDSRKIVLDSFGWIEYFAGGPKAAHYAGFVAAAKPENYFTPTVVIYEVYKKIKSYAGEAEANRLVAQITKSTTVVPLSNKIAVAAAELSLSPELSLADSVVKATAEEFDAVLVSSDPHFKKMSGVEFV